MIISSYMVLAMSMAVQGLRRGPHHPHGQQPVEQKHHHYQPKLADSLTSQSELLHDTKHLEEDSDEMTAEKLAKMSPEELEFHYFLAHDFDKNSKLDGLELLKAVYHTMDHERNEVEPEDAHEGEENDIDGFIAMIDQTLTADDTDGDGYLSYPEYRAARANRPPSDGTPIVLAARPPSDGTPIVIAAKPPSDETPIVIAARPP